MNTKDKLIDKIEDVLEKFYHDEQYEMEDGVEAILALISQERERLLKVIGEDEDHSAYTATQSIGMIERNKLRAEQRKALTGMKEGGK